MATKARPHEFGKYLRAKRKADRWSQRAIASKLGVSDAYLAGVEGGTSKPLPRKYWPALVNTIAGVTIADLERHAARTRPLQIDLSKASPEYVELALGLAERIRSRDLSDDEVPALLAILARARVSSST